MKIYVYEIEYKKETFSPLLSDNCSIEIEYEEKTSTPFLSDNCSIEDVEIVNYDYTNGHYFCHKGVLTACCAIWELNSYINLFCSLRKLTLNELSKINIFLEKK